MSDLKRKKITICRHFRTQNTSDWEWMSAQKFNEWVRFYESSLPLKGHKGESDSKDWEICVSSSLPRAIATAQIYAKNIPIEYNSDLNEVPFVHFNNSFFLPKAGWLFISRLCWFFGNGEYENRKKTVSRVNKVIMMLREKNERSILIVSHGFFMNCLARELKLLRFKGHLSIYPKHGKFYIFESYSI
ncbi:MAG: histidine phosphatase family protein [Candidatus Omnitrophota bacterium]|nr:histidine phosphatase family protein [Candidatus Omnitrophota bacterium]